MTAETSPLADKNTPAGTLKQHTAYHHLNVGAGQVRPGSVKAIPHNSKCRYGERGAADAKPKAQIILDAAKVSAASGGNSEPKQGQRSQSARGFCPRSTMRVPQPDIIEHFGNADAVPQPPERCLSRKAGIMRYCLSTKQPVSTVAHGLLFIAAPVMSDAATFLNSPAGRSVSRTPRQSTARSGRRQRRKRSRCSSIPDLPRGRFPPQPAGV